MTSSDGNTVAYQVSGRGRPAIVFIHGWLCDRTFWREQVAEFEKTNRVLTLDLTGHGGSDKQRENWSMQAFGEDVAAVVRAERLGRVVLVGHSMGGSVMVAAADILGDRVVGIVGVDTLPDIDQLANDVVRMSRPGALELRMAGARADYYRTVRGFVNAMFTPNSDPELRRWVTERMTSTPKEVGLGAAEGLLAYDVIPALDRVTENRYLINRGKPAGGTNDKSAAKHGFELTLVDNVGHFIMLEAPDRFNELLRGIIKQIR